MIDSESHILLEIQQKISGLLKERAELLQEINNLKLENEKLQMQLTKAEEEKISLETRNKMLMIVRSVGDIENGKRDIKLAINALLKEIDYSIALLNE
jgi:regulator of replication initiation timing